MQPIGGANQKIEGFYATCKMKGLSGSQGVLLPAQNVKNLMLKPEVVEAVKAGKFHIWAVSHVDQGMEITGVRSGTPDEPDTIHGRVAARLQEFSQALQGQRAPDERTVIEVPPRGCRCRRAASPAQSPASSSPSRRPDRESKVESRESKRPTPSAERVESRDLRVETANGGTSRSTAVRPSRSTLSRSHALRPFPIPNSQFPIANCQFPNPESRVPNKYDSAGDPVKL